MLAKLVRTEYQPAYLFHAPPQLPPGETPEKPYLAGRHQRLPDKTLSLTGDRSVVTVPAGTELVLTATADKDLLDAAIRPKIGHVPGAKPGSADPVPLLGAPWWFRLTYQPGVPEDVRMAGPQAVALPAAHAGLFIGLGAKPQTASAPVGRFFEMQSDRQREIGIETPTQLAKLLADPKATEGRPPLVKKIELNRPNADFF